MLRWKWRCEFDDLLIDINDAKMGWILDQEDHVLLEKLGWGEEWDHFWAQDKKLTKDDVLEQLTDMMEDKRFKKILERGREAEIRYPREAERAREGLEQLNKRTKSSGRLKSSGLKKLGLTITIVGGACSCGQFANAAAGGCEKERSDMMDWLAKFGAKPNQANCQDAVYKMYEYFQCAGFPDGVNNVFYLKTLAEACSKAQ
ncbi:MAG: hypothetical protein R3E01_06750 [Pirellulaceae bacterium]